MLDDHGAVRAILDWEICTLGDPLADLGLLMVYWADAATPRPCCWSPTTAPGFSTRAEVLERYAQRASDRDLSRIGYYVRVRLLEAGLHPPGRLCPLRRRRRAGDQGSVEAFPAAGGPPGRDGGRGLGGHAMSPDGLTEIFEVHGEPDFDRPVLVIALEGWVDAGLGATTAIAALLAQGPTEPLVTFNGDHFLDQRARRPVARIVNGVTTELTWPRTRCAEGTTAPAPTSSIWSALNPTSTGGPSPTPWSGWPGRGGSAWWSASAHSRRRLPTPVRCNWPPRLLRRRPAW